MTEHNDDFDRSLTERLRAYEERVAAGPPPNLDSIGSGASLMGRTGWGWGALVGAAGGAAGLLLVLAISGRLSPPTGQATATPGPTISFSPSATPSPAPSGLEPLSMVPVVGLAVGDELRAVIQVDGRLIAVGRRGDQGAVWTSPDGTSWTLAPDLPAEKAESNAATTMTSIVAGPGGLVAAGSRTGIDYSAPRTWQSTDGQRWTSITVPSGVAGGRIEALAVGEPGYVGVGLMSDDGYTGRPQMWSSADGRKWTVVDSPAFTGSLNDVTGGAGMLVAVGATEGHAGALVSTDGATWTVAPAQEALQGAEMTSVTYGNGTFVATGLLSGLSQALPASPAIWHSADGLHWTLVLRGEPGQMIRQVVSNDAGFVAIGGDFPSHWWQYDPAAPNPPRDTVQLWFSADGETWSGPTTGFLADGGVTLGRATISGGELILPITLLNKGPSGPLARPAILRRSLRTTN
jgi:hypothetical protein